MLLSTNFPVTCFCNSVSPSTNKDCDDLQTLMQLNYCKTIYTFWDGIHTLYYIIIWLDWPASAHILPITKIDISKKCLKFVYLWFFFWQFLFFPRLFLVLAPNQKQTKLCIRIYIKSFPQRYTYDANVDM